MLSIVLTVFLVKSQRSPRVEAKSPPVTATAPAETISPADSQAAVAGVNSADALSSAELESAVERGPIVPDENSLLGIRSETPVDAHSLFQFETRADREGIQSDVHKQIRGKIDGAGSPLGGAPFAKP